ncbi:hypothetical protein LIPSTDRAFT_323699 [Lipomyces starkeyi NRRL Y-11557]|uniref:Uncharacterized protein n=1 Tax=Lipomyces starkeyi NRRL Y-11557 TaxID=675824 RepID=A0A1E3Q199_LIPST|nr:hypothetical protein LIPSTDRAFT_323699 [Lipomyces starkeyi NRRL Y-11557]
MIDCVNSATGQQMQQAKIRMDNGLEFGGGKLHANLKGSNKNSLLTPEQKGKGESPHKELIKMSGLTQELWPEALKHVTKLSNISSTRALNGESLARTMELLLYSHKQPPKPYASHIRIWGCIAWVLIPGKRRARSASLEAS